MTGRELRPAVRRLVARAARRAAALGRRLGVLPYRPERRSADEWTSAYEAGHLGYYGALDELARYSVLVGYVGWFAAGRGDPPTVLDVGCGTGLLRERLEGVPLAGYVGVDLSRAAVAAAEGRGFARSRFVVGDAATLDLGRSDVVVLNEVLYYAPDPAAFLRRVRDLVAPDGLVLVSMWRHPGDRSLWRTVDRLLPILDRVEVRDPANAVNPRGWWVAACRPGPEPDPGIGPAGGSGPAPGGGFRAGS